MRGDRVHMIEGLDEDLLHRKLEKLRSIDQQREEENLCRVPHNEAQSAAIFVPSYWKMAGICKGELTASMLEAMRMDSFDVTKEMKSEMQILMDDTCNTSTLGSGRDQKVKSPAYTRLQVAKVLRIENPSLWHQYASHRMRLLTRASVPITEIQTQITNAAKLRSLKL